ncbi:MAG TPA: LysE family translocator [Roseomonas sp.]|jgi:threonine/homoserine/homoserine lactone efflux protein
MPVDPALLAGYLGACVLLILTPGPDMAFVLGQALAGGARRGWAATLGIMAGALCHVTAAALGVAALVATHPALFTTLRLAGAAYLLWLGVQAIRSALAGGGGLVPKPGSAGGGLGPAFRQGMLTNLLNPKVGLFFLAFVPQFVDPGRAAPGLQMLILGPLLPLLSLPFFAVLIAGAGRVAARLRTGRAARWLDGIAGTLFCGLGLRLLVGAPK